jgi:hypothetical protein
MLFSRLLQVNSSWKISGSTLRIDEADLIKRAGRQDYLQELALEISALVKTQKEKKAANEKKKEEAEEVDA